MIAVAVFLLVPVLLFWFGATHCDDLACIGPFLNALLHAITVIPLLLLWRTRNRALYPAMLVFSEVAMAIATFRHEFEFSPQFTAFAIAMGLAVGTFVGLTIEEFNRRSREQRR